MIIAAEAEAQEKLVKDIKAAEAAEAGRQAPGRARQLTAGRGPAEGRRARRPGQAPARRGRPGRGRRGGPGRGAGARARRPRPSRRPAAPRPRPPAGQAEAEGAEAGAAEGTRAKALADAAGIGEKLKAEAEGLTEKAAAMAALDDASRGHEEYRLRLEAEKEIRLAGLDVQRQVAEAQATVLATGLEKADIDIVGGDIGLLRPAGRRRSRSARASTASWSTPRPAQALAGPWLDGIVELHRRPDPGARLGLHGRRAEPDRVRAADAADERRTGGCRTVRQLLDRHAAGLANVRVEVPACGTTPVAARNGAPLRADGPGRPVRPRRRRPVDAPSRTRRSDGRGSPRAAPACGIEDSVGRRPRNRTHRREPYAWTPTPPHLDAGTYEVLRDRLAAQAAELARRAEALNARRTEAFGSTELRLAGTERIRTEQQLRAARHRRRRRPAAVRLQRLPRAQAARRPSATSSRCTDARPEPAARRRRARPRSTTRPSCATSTELLPLLPRQPACSSCAASTAGCWPCSRPARRPTTSGSCAGRSPPDGSPGRTSTRAASATTSSRRRTTSSGPRPPASDHVLGRHPHISIEGEVFVETRRRQPDRQGRGQHRDRRGHLRRAGRRAAAVPRRRRRRVRRGRRR